VDSSLKTGTSSPDAPSLEDDSAPNPDRSTGYPMVARASFAFLSRQAERLLERTAQPFAAIDFEGRFLQANRAFEELTGYSSEELSTLTLDAITPEQWHEAGRAILAQVRATGISARYEKEYLRKDGTLVPVEALADLNRDERDEPIGFTAFITDIGERKRVEAALRDSEERFRRLYDEAPVGYHVIDTEGRVVSMNKTECEMLGYTREEVIGRLVFDFITPESRAQALAAFPEKIRGDHPLRTIERTIETRDGRRLVVAIEERYKRDEQGRVVGIRSTVQDITDRKRTEAALVASERRARILFEGIEDAVFVHAPDGRILDANPSACRLLGYSRAELLSMTTNDIDEPEFAAGYEKRLENQLTHGHLSCEGRHRTKDGRVVPVEINSSTIQFDDQRAVLAVIRDITERKALEETRREFAEAQMRNALAMEAKNRELTESEARYRQLTEGCLDSVVVVDAQGMITLFNPAAEKIFGFQSVEVLGQPFDRLIPGVFGGQGGCDGEDVPAPLKSKIVGKTVELVGRRKGNEEFPLEISLSAVDLDGELQYIGSIRDQTERHRMRAMLTQSEKLASIGLLSAGVAHEINNPLAYVGNNLAVLERDLAGVLQMISLYEQARDVLKSASPDLFQQINDIREEVDWDYVRDNLHRMLARTREGVQRVANIVSNLRGLARTSPPKMETVLIPDLLESALEMIRGRMRRHNIEVKVEHAEGLPRLTCVPSQISQVILNLLINAVQAIETTGRMEGGLIRFQTSSEGDSILIAISDNGCGIETASLSQLFDPFFTTKSVGEGTGLGLSITHGIITGHGGRIDVESRQGDGTCFRIYLPLKSSG
jgi:two-component system, NtrC family, sensor kinase